jgi:alkaline phosphatase D
LASLGGAALTGWPRRAPAQHRDRPHIVHGVAAGDVTPMGGVVWSRTDRAAKMWVEWATTPDFRDARRVEGPDALEASDFTGKVALTGLPPGRRVYYRVSFADLYTGALSIPEVGQLKVPPVTADRPVSFAWSGDTCGQGYGINPDVGGMRIYSAIRAERPDVFIHCGDLIYADAPIRPRKRVHGGRVWRNLVTDAKAKVAESLHEFRGNFRYNLLDEHVRHLAAEIPQIVQWDDHETKNNWWPGRMLNEDDRYAVKSCSLLAARARRAFFEYTPIARRATAPGRIYRALPQGPLLDIFVLDARSYRGPNTYNRALEIGPETAFFGEAQLDWLCQRLVASKATWKLIASDQPVGVQIGHDGRYFEGMANGNGGRPSGRELELARLLRFVKEKGIQNIAWVTADVHYAAAHHYHPDRATFRRFSPFWEFVAGPLNAGTFGPNYLDPTFGPKAEFISVERGMRPGLSPFSGLQFYGVGRVDPESRALTVSLHRANGERLWSTRLPAM